ncbi:hypothetical protein [Halorarum salinum]|uniref:Uncharacterized protein n=1 Tax=Halorarum salinum TaxID=2743089 RepID=A0A7D5LBS9_9EURY|nr:hypothetical protein [Halobaculum salinum]QLG62791.1 hypothetical protein HUG12_14065 [Halobaculum salinum]
MTSTDERHSPVVVLDAGVLVVNPVVDDFHGVSPEVDYTLTAVTVLQRRSRGVMQHRP